MENSAAYTPRVGTRGELSTGCDFDTPPLWISGGGACFARGPVDKRGVIWW